MRLRFLRAAVFLLATAILLPAQQRLTVEKLTGFIDSSIKNHIPDRDVASYLATAKMSERLTPSMVEDMQGKGAGPKTLAALQRLAEASSALPMAARKRPSRFTWSLLPRPKKNSRRC